MQKEAEDSGLRESPIRSPGVSIVLPVYNGAEYLEQCIRSVLEQCYGDFELVIGDDGSKDASLDIIRSFVDPRIRLSKNTSPRGLFANLNHLVRDSSAPLVHILCQDDLMESNCLGEVTRFLNANPSAGMVFSKFKSIDSQGDVIKECELGDLPDVMPPVLTLQCLYYHGCIPGNLSTVCIRRACFDAIGVFDESYGVSSDYEMWARIGRRWDMGVLHKHLLKIRFHDKQLSNARQSGLEFIEQNRRVCQTLLPQLPVQIRAKARAYGWKRFSVLALHYGLRSLAAGELDIFVGVIRSLGAVDFLRALFYWTITMNNRLYRPAWHFAVPEPKVSAGEKMHG
jgi:glycosyltransferase involved in cell wall biosynthesis